MHVVAYCDADWAGCVDDRKSTTGLLLLLCGCPVAWLSKKQATVALSSAEAEYMAISQALREVKWIHALLARCGLRQPPANQEKHKAKQLQGASSASARVSVSPRKAIREQVHPTPIRTDNQSAAAMCMSTGGLHSRTKHIDVRHHFIRDAVKSGEVELRVGPKLGAAGRHLHQAIGPCHLHALRDKLMDDWRATVVVACVPKN